MATTTGIRLTKAGERLLAKIHTGGHKLKLTEFVLGDEAWSTEEIEAGDYSALKRERVRAPVTRISRGEGIYDGRVVATGVISNEGIREPFYVREIGLMAEDPDDGEILYMIDPITAEAPTTMIESDSVPQEVPINMELVAVSSSQVEVLYAKPELLVSVGMCEENRSNMCGAIHSYVDERIRDIYLFKPDNTIPITSMEQIYNLEPGNHWVTQVTRHAFFPEMYDAVMEVFGEGAHKVIRCMPVTSYTHRNFGGGWMYVMNYENGNWTDWHRVGIEYTYLDGKDVVDLSQEGIRELPAGRYHLSGLSLQEFPAGTGYVDVISMGISSPYPSKMITFRELYKNGSWQMRGTPVNGEIRWTDWELVGGDSFALKEEVERIRQDFTDEDILYVTSIEQIRNLKPGNYRVRQNERQVIFPDMVLAFIEVFGNDLHKLVRCMPVTRSGQRNFGGGWMYIMACDNGIWTDWYRAAWEYTYLDPLTSDLDVSLEAVKNLPDGRYHLANVDLNEFPHGGYLDIISMGLTGSYPSKIMTLQNPSNVNKRQMWATPTTNGQLQWSQNWELVSGLEGSLRANGWAKLPGGLIIQWGYGVTDETETKTICNLPVAFPNQGFRITVTDIANGAHSYGAGFYCTSQIEVTSRSPITGAVAKGSFQYIAIGH